MLFHLIIRSGDFEKHPRNIRRHRPTRHPSVSV
jgi:hypothetical protein